MDGTLGIGNEALVSEVLECTSRRKSVWELRPLRQVHGVMEWRKVVVGSRGRIWVNKGKSDDERNLSIHRPGRSPLTQTWV